MTPVLHPYYKLDYIKMAWGGPEEQTRDREAGNENAKDWQDEALQVIEKAMSTYWCKPQPVSDDTGNSTEKEKSCSHAEAADRVDEESEFDQHRRILLQQSQGYNGGGLAAELHHYFSDMPVDVKKDTDIVQWWQVHAILSLPSASFI